MEPRLLLSGDGFLGVVAADFLADSSEPKDAILVENDSQVTVSEALENDLFGVEDEAISEADSTAKSDAKTADPDATPAVVDGENDDAEAADGSAEMSGFVATEGALSGTDEAGLEATGSTDRSDELSDELVTTLHAANGPPQDGAPLEQRDAVQTASSGSEFTSGSGFAVFGSHGTQLSAFESPGTQIGAGDFLFASGQPDESK